MSSKIKRLFGKHKQSSDDLQQQAGSAQSESDGTHNPSSPSRRKVSAGSPLVREQPPRRSYEVPQRGAQPAPSRIQRTSGVSSAQIVDPSSIMNPVAPSSAYHDGHTPRGSAITANETLYLPPQDTDLSSDLSYLTLASGNESPHHFTGPSIGNAFAQNDHPYYRARAPAQAGGAVRAVVKPRDHGHTYDERSAGRELYGKPSSAYASDPRRDVADHFGVVGNTRLSRPDGLQQAARSYLEKADRSPERERAASPTSTESRASISRKPVPAGAPSLDSVTHGNEPSSQSDTARQLSTDKPLPHAPRGEEERADDELDPSMRRSLDERGYLVKDATTTPSLKGIVDLRNTVDTSVHTRHAPAVIHEHIRNHTTEIVQERITREIHEHHNFHRILPIVDVEVLPPRHFVPAAGGGYVEVAAKDLPAKMRDDHNPSNWAIVETVSKMASDDPAPKGPRKFTARAFPGNEGDEISYITPEGFERRETTWVHPPRLEELGKYSGQTQPFYFDHSRPDGSGDGFAPPPGFAKGGEV